MEDTWQEEDRGSFSGEGTEDGVSPCGYEMEELLPIVARLAESYTAYESTSVTYEKAEQLMEAVLYCIRAGAWENGEMVPVLTEPVSAEEAYKTGKACVERMVKKGLALYHRILSDFSDYGNRCLGDTVRKGIPEFFKWYDVKQDPQNTIVTLDYPVLQDISHCTGIRRIYAFLKCVELEQRFLGFFPGDTVIRILEADGRMYEEMVENICETVFTAVTVRGFLQKILPEYGFLGENGMQEYLLGSSQEEIGNGLRQAGAFFLDGAFGEARELREYLFQALPGMAARLKNAAENGGLWRYAFQVLHDDTPPVAP